jgi:hypothetical protein
MMKVELKDEAQALKWPSRRATRGSAHSATSVARHHANYGWPEARTGEFPVITFLSSVFSACLRLASFPLCALCALVVDAFSFPSLEVLWRIFDQRPTTNDDRA